MDQSDVDLLQTTPPHHLQAVLKVRQVALTTRGQITEPPVTTFASLLSTAPTEIAEQLFAPDLLQESLRGLSTLETLILRELTACGGRANSRDLALYFSSSGLLAAEKKTASTDEHERLVFEPVQIQSYQGISPVPQYPTAHPHGVFELALRRLLVLGLLFWGKQTNFAGRDYSSGVHDGVLIVPLAVKEAAQSVWGSLSQPPSLSTSSQEVGEGARLLQRKLYLYWSFVASMREGLSLLSNGLLSRAAFRQMTEAMGIKTQGEQIRSESDVSYLLFLRLLLIKLGLLQDRQGALCAAPAEAFFSLSLLERARSCYHLWLDTSFWNELLYIPDVVVRPGSAPLEPAHEEVMRSRHAVLTRLLYEQDDGWHDLATFVARTKLYAPYLLFPRQYGARAERYSNGSNPYGWDFRLRRGWLTHREGWHLVEGGFIRTMLSGPLRWLGVLDIDQEERPGRFRFAQGGVFLASDMPAEQKNDPWGRLIVQPNFELVALAPVSEALLVHLDRFAERIGLEHIAQYRLTKASITRAIQMGLHADSIQKALEKAAGGEIPQNVQYSLVEWERQARRVELWQSATLLEVDDSALLDELMADEKARRLLGRRLAPSLVEVSPRHLPALQEILWQRDYLPAVTSAPTQDFIADHGHLVEREAQWKLHDDGLLQPLYAVSDLYLMAEVRRFTEPDEAAGGRRITPASLCSALEGGLALEQVVRFLQSYCQGGVPASLLIRLKLWGGGYGEQRSIHIEQAPLLRLPAQVLQDLQRDHELSTLLGEEVEHGQRLVHVKTENLERIVALLRERGFSVD